MLHDAGLDFLFKSAAFLTGTPSSDIIDLNAGGVPAGSPTLPLRKLFSGSNPLVLEAIVNATFAGAGGTSMKLTLQDSADGSTGWAAVAADGTTQLIETAVIPAAQLVAGYQFAFPSHMNVDVKRYVKILGTIVGTFTVSGNDPCLLTIGLVHKSQTNHI